MSVSVSNMGNNLLALVIIVSFFFILYSKMFNKSFTEIYTQMKEFFGGE